jgi:hypothetical protein
MAWDLLIQEIHATLGADEFAYTPGTTDERYLNMARNIDYLAKSFGLYYSPDGTVLNIKADVNPRP